MLFGHNACGHQRYRCKICNHTYTFRNHKNKEFHERVWFKLWIVEGYSIRQLVDISHRGIWKMKNIVSLWLARSPEIVLLNYRSIKHLLCDGTYFNHENCLLAVMDNRDNRIINHIYCIRENYENAMMVFQQLHGLGTRPESITMDGNTSVIRAIKAVWPNIIIQRCLAHIQRQGLSWLRRNPKLAAGKELRLILLGITEIKNGGDKAVFLKQFQLLEQEHGRVVENLSTTLPCSCSQSWNCFKKTALSPPFLISVIPSNINRNSFPAASLGLLLIHDSPCRWMWARHR